MTIELNHTIVKSRDKSKSAEFLARILGLPTPVPFSHFVTVELGNRVMLDFDNAKDVQPQHYAFLVDDGDFGPILERVKAEQISFYADPGHQRENRVNTRDRGRGFYFSDPDGHNLEVLTRVYGSGQR